MWWQTSSRLLGLLALARLASAASAVPPDTSRRPMDGSNASSAIPASLFWELERLSRVVDISYCVGNTGVRKPFTCLSRCNEFPELSLVTTWSTGLLLTDSCGYIAVDHGGRSSSSSSSSSAAGGHGGGAAIMVVFRGTYSITNTIVDLSTVPQTYLPYPGPDDDGRGPKCVDCTVHMGFLESWRQARAVVVPELKALRAQHPSLPVHLVGHSLGGAVACLAALELRASLGWHDVLVTTFGEPRVGNQRLARFIDELFDLVGDTAPEARSFRRVTHSDDPVPLLPWDGWGYRPHAGEIYIAKPDLPPAEEDLRSCVGDHDAACSAGAEGHLWPAMRRRAGTTAGEQRFRLGQLFTAHRDYFWRLGLCVPGGDPANWAASEEPDEL